MNAEFLDAVREGDWHTAQSLIREGAVTPALESQAVSLFEWLVDINAPPKLIVDLLRVHSTLKEPNLVERRLMEACLQQSTTRSNAFGTFKLLLASGVSPNLIIEGGSTLLQRAMELNRVHEVQELLHNEVDPNQMSVFDLESTSNLEEAARLTNESAKLVLKHFNRNS